MLPLNRPGGQLLPRGGEGSLFRTEIFDQRTTSVNLSRQTLLSKLGDVFHDRFSDDFIDRRQSVENQFQARFTQSCHALLSCNIANIIAGRFAAIASRISSDMIRNS
jgi:hypothetical protein